MELEEYRTAEGKLEFPPDYTGRRLYVTVDGFNYSIPCIYCYFGADRRWRLNGTETEVNGAPMIIRDLEPYRSPLDGSMVTSRSEHRAHMRKHGVIERGNEPMQPFKPKEMPRAGRDISRALG